MFHVISIMPLFASFSTKHIQQQNEIHKRNINSFSCSVFYTFLSFHISQRVEFLFDVFSKHQLQFILKICVLNKVQMTLTRYSYSCCCCGWFYICMTFVWLSCWEMENKRKAKQFSLLSFTSLLLRAQQVILILLDIKLLERTCQKCK